MEVRLLLPQPSKEGTAETAASTTVATILGNTSTLATLVGDVWDIMTANPILTLFICAGLVTLGFSIFRKAKRAARG